MSAATPGITAQDAPDAHEASLECTVFFHGLNEIGGAAGGIAAACHGAGQYVQWAAQKAFVK